VVEKVLAAVRVAPSKTEIREYPMPDIPEDAALMKMEVAGSAEPTSSCTRRRRPRAR
jgi:hypothetical protein